MEFQSVSRRVLMEQILNSKRLGEKKFHSETSLQKFGEENEKIVTVVNEDISDPGVTNSTLNIPHPEHMIKARKRAVSQPGPDAGGAMETAAAVRAARKRPTRNVMYAPDLVRSESDRVSKQVKQSGEGSGTATPTGNSTGDRGIQFAAPLYSSNFKNGDAKSLSSYRYAPASERSGTLRYRSMGVADAQSIRSMETQAPAPTDPQDNKKLTRNYITIVMSTIYAILLVTLGLVIHVADVFVSWPLSSCYSLFLSCIGLVYLVYLMIDIGQYKKTAVKNQVMKEQYEEQISEYFRKNEEAFNIDVNGEGPELYKPHDIPQPVPIPLKHMYCFSQGRHSGSFYLKMGAAGFAVGSLVHSVLLIAEQLSVLFDNDVNNQDCIEYLQVTLDFFYPFYCFIQLFFIFKYSNVIVLRAQGLAQFGFMHMVGSSLCFWIAAIVRETVLALKLYAQLKNGGYGKDSSETGSSEELSSSEEIVFERGTRAGLFNISNLVDENCLGTASLNEIYENYSPYLYPFTVEFNILIVAVYYIIWSNIGHCANEDANFSDINASDVESDALTVCKIPTVSEENDFTSNLVIYADCHRSNRGVFSGIIVMVIIIGMLILGFVFSNFSGGYLRIGHILGNATKLSLHSVMLFVSILAMIQTMKLDINLHPISLLDDILLFICLPLFFMEALLSLAATLTIVNVVASLDFIIMVLQVLVQTPLIMDGLRRCCNSRKLRRRKPGRELIMFLIITNVVMWLFYTFSYKSPESLDERYSYYGKELWTILGHVSLPLIMFYRFHSSVCFADIWGCAYKPGSEH